jgi:hypothetical protein
MGGPARAPLYIIVAQPRWFRIPTLGKRKPICNLIENFLSPDKEPL